MANLSKPVSWMLRLSILAVVVFVAWNLWQSRTVEMIDQSSVAGEPPVQTNETMNSNPEKTVSGDGTAKRSGSFSGRNGYAATGSLSITEIDDGLPVMEFSDDFSASDGPDLVVWLSPNRYGSGEELGEVVSLGAVKKLSGRQVYNLPEDIDRYQSVVIWCRGFNVAFGVADLE